VNHVSKQILSILSIAPRTSCAFLCGERRRKTKDDTLWT